MPLTTDDRQQLFRVGSGFDYDASQDDTELWAWWPMTGLEDYVGNNRLTWNGSGNDTTFPRNIPNLGQTPVKFTSSSNTNYMDTGISLANLSTFSISCWLRRWQSADLVYVSQSTALSNVIQIGMFSDNNTYFGVNAGSFFAYNDGNTLGWIHFGLTYDASLGSTDRMKCYVNGVDQGASVASSTYTGGGTLLIGRRTKSTLNSDGFYHDVRVSKKCWTAGQMWNTYMQPWKIIKPSAPFFFFTAPSTAQTVVLGLPSETDTALAVTSAKSKTLGIPSETDTALPVTPLKSKTLGLPSETDSVPGAVTKAKSQSVGIVVETDTALSITSAKAKSLGLVTETDTALPIGPTKSITIGLVTETDSVPGGLSKAKAFSLGLVTETDTALGVTTGAATTVGLVTETDSALPISSAKTVTLGLLTETDSALGVTTGGSTSVGLVTETDSALPVTPIKTRTLGLVTETDTALAVVVNKSIILGLVTETDSAFALSSAKAKSLGLVTETDTALALASGATVIELGIVTETDSALPVTVGFVGVAEVEACVSVGRITVDEVKVGVRVVGQVRR